MTKPQRQATIYLVFLYLPVLIALLLFTQSPKKESFSKYLKNHYPVRHWALKANALIQIRLLGSTNLGNIHIGKHPWLFYITESDGNSSRDLWGLPKEHIDEAWTKYLQQTLQKPFGFNSKYILVLPPNKESVYPEKLRYLFLDSVPQDHKNYSRVIQVARSLAPDNVVPLKETLVRGKETFPTFHSGDTHWNQWGAYLAHRDIIQAVNKVMGSRLEIISAEPSISSETPEHDILKMFNGADRTIAYEADAGPNIVVNFPQLPKAVEDLPYTVSINPTGQYTVWFLGDSFGERLKSFLNPYFGKVIFIKGTNKVLKRSIAKAYSEHGHPDLIIEERVERYLNNPVGYRDFAKELGFNPQP